MRGGPIYEVTVVSTVGTVGLIELNDPDRRNPSDPRTSLAEINDALLDIGRDRAIRAVVLFGRGESFCAGANFGQRRPARYPQDDEQSNAERLAYGYAYGQMWDVLHSFKKPLVAAARGHCYGGGWELAHARDLIVAGESARFGVFEITVGLIPLRRRRTICRRWSEHRAMDLVLNGRVIDAGQAEEWGVVNTVVPDDKCLEHAMELAAELAARPPIAVAFARQLIKRTMGVTENYDLERAYGFYLGAPRTRPSLVRPKWNGSRVR
jgi:enoyl-CoA hydratase/carnithine racemase